MKPLRARSAAIRQEMAGLVAQRDELENFFKDRKNARLNERSTFLNSLIDEQSLNWTQMFMDMEKSCHRRASGQHRAGPRKRSGKS